MMSDTASGTLTFPAEWDERVDCVLIAYPSFHTDWNYIIEEARECFDNIIKTISVDCGVKTLVVGDFSTIRARLGSKGIYNNNIMVFDVDYNDTWARDFGPLTIIDATGNIQFADFKFNGWGLKYPSANDNLICRLLDSYPLTQGKMVNKQDFVLEGGSIESDGKGTILTTSTCLLSPNRNGALSKEEIENRLKKDLGAKRVLWIDNGALEGDDTDSHIDTLVRFTDEHTLVYVKCFNMMDSHFHSLSKMEKELEQLKDIDGNSYRLVPLPLPYPVYDDESRRLPATYANFLILPGHVLVPTYGQPENDFAAMETIASLFPGRKVTGVDCSTLIKQHGSLHCVSMQMITGTATQTAR